MAEKTEAKVFSVEELRQRLQAAPAVYAGVMVQQGWRAGKMVSERDFAAAISQFLNTPTKGGR